MSLVIFPSISAIDLSVEQAKCLAEKGSVLVNVYTTLQKIIPSVFPTTGQEFQFHNPFWKVWSVDPDTGRVTTELTEEGKAVRLKALQSCYVPGYWTITNPHHDRSRFINLMVFKDEKSLITFFGDFKLKDLSAFHIRNPDGISVPFSVCLK